jgi:heme/copper-type cytochrome/quinol oxidase subunit 2
VGGFALTSVVRAAASGVSGPRRPSRPYSRRVEILLWLVPPAVVTLLAMAWVSWLGHAGRGEVDREAAVRRLARAMQKEHPGPGKPRPVALVDRSTGVAVRRSTRRAS